MKGTNIKSLSIAMIMTSLIVLGITIGAEFSETFKTFLASITGHHWTTKSVISALVFFGLYGLLSRSDDDLDVWKESRVVGIVAILVTIGITAFFVAHYLLG